MGSCVLRILGMVELLPALVPVVLNTNDNITTLTIVIQFQFCVNSSHSKYKKYLS